MDPYVLLEKNIHILALEMASRRNRHCANGLSAHYRSLLAARVSVTTLLAVAKLGRLVLSAQSIRCWTHY